MLNFRSPALNSLRLELLRRLSSTALLQQNPSPTPHFMVEYLITSCGFPPEKAAKSSKYFKRIISADQPDSVVAFFRSHGFDESQIKNLVSWYPRWLSLDAEKTWKPKFQALQDVGFSGSDLINLIISNPSVLEQSMSRKLLPKIKLWTTILGSTNCLKKLFRRNCWIFSYSISERIMPNLTLIKERGISDQRIAMLLNNDPEILCKRPDSIKALLSLVERLGVPCTSRMFLPALRTIVSISESNFKAKIQLMVSLGWSEPEFSSAFCKAPVFISFSEKTIREKMDFLVNVVGCQPSYVASNPILLMFSLERRMVPRHRAMQLLKSEGLEDRKRQLMSTMGLSEKKFMDKFILRHSERLPQLQEAYVTCRDKGGVSHSWF